MLYAKNLVEMRNLTDIENNYYENQIKFCSTRRFKTLSRGKTKVENISIFVCFQINHDIFTIYSTKFKNQFIFKH